MENKLFKIFQSSFLKEMGKDCIEIDAPYRPGGPGDQTTTEEFIKYVRENLCKSKNAQNHFDKFFDEELRGSGFASYRDWYPAMPVCSSITGNIVKIPKVDSPGDIMSVCAKRTKEDLRIPTCPIWYLHEGFIAIIENKKEIFKKGIKDIMFYFFDSKISLNHVHIHFNEINNVSITLTGLGIVSCSWQEIARRGEMHVILNRNTDFRNLFLW